MRHLTLSHCVTLQLAGLAVAAAATAAAADSVEWRLINIILLLRLCITYM